MSNIYITPPSLMTLVTNIEIKSEEYNLGITFIQINLQDGQILIFSNKLLLESDDKSKLSLQFLDFLKNNTIFLSNSSQLTFNNYLVVKNGSPINLLLAPEAIESTDMSFLLEINKRYGNMKVFW